MSDIRGGPSQNCTIACFIYRCSSCPFASIININKLSTFVLLVSINSSLTKQKGRFDLMLIQLLDSVFLKVLYKRTEFCPFQVMFEAINFVKQYETTLLFLFFGTVCLQNKSSHVMTVIFKVVGEEDYQSHANNDHLRINWTREMDCYFIDLMLE